MQLRTKWGALVLVALLLGSLGTAGLVFAKSDSSVPAVQTSASSSLPATLHTAPLNPAYVQYQQQKAAGQVATQTVDGHGLGWVPPPYELSNLTTAPRLMQAQTSYPATYDLRTYGKVSPVGDQGQSGSCWTFATFGSLESYLLPGLTTQYSENNLKNLNGFDPNGDYTCNAGGDSGMSTAYLARWGTTMTGNTGSNIYAGPVTSASDPYSDSSCTSRTTSQTAMHVQNVYFLPKMTSGTDTSEIKSALMTYGGVYTAFAWDGGTSTSSYYNSATAAYFDGTAEQANHAVTIVGWDNNYAKTNFSTPPQGNGAWLCKNSWGTSFGKSGYFYVSYYDANMGHQENTVFTAEPTTNYTTNYQYDPFGMETSWGSGSTTAYGANVFTATSTGTLKAVSFWALAPGTEYTAQIYVNPSNSNIPTSGTLMSTLSGSVSYAGYYTESLSTTVPLTNGERFAVVVEFTTPGDGNPVPVQSREAGWDDNAPNAIAGQSFWSSDGTTWTDFASYGAANSLVANIHAFESSTPPTVAGAPAVSAQNANSLDLFFRGNDSALWWKHWDGTTWSASVSQGGILTSDPATASPGNGVVDVFVRGSDNAIWEKTTTNGGASWSGWTSLGGQIPSGTVPTVCSWGSGRLDLFAQGTDGQLWWKYSTNGGSSWTGWQPLGGQLTSSAAAVAAPGSSRIDVFVRGTDGAIWQRTTTNKGSSWSGWTSRGGQIPVNTIPAASSWGTGRLDLFANGTDGQLWWQYTTNGGSSWTGWQPLGGQLTSSPAAAAPASGKMDVFVRGGDNGLWERTYASGSWSGWTPIAI
jgi:C1A family cysteine protease